MNNISIRQTRGYEQLSAAMASAKKEYLQSLEPEEFFGTIGKPVKKKYFESLEPKEFFGTIKAPVRKKYLNYFTPKERLGGFKPEQIRAGLKPEDRKKLRELLMDD